MHGRHTVGGMQVHHYPDIIAVLAHASLQPEMQGYLTAGSELTRNICVRYLLPERQISFYDTDLFELIRLQGLLAHARWRDVEMISIMMPDRHIAIPTGYPVALICFDQGFADGF